MLFSMDDQGDQARMRRLRIILFVRLGAAWRCGVICLALLCGQASLQAAAPSDIHSSILNPSVSALSALGAINGGAASSLSGVSAVVLALSDQGTQQWWDGVAWNASPVFVTATGTTAWSWPAALPLWQNG